MKYRPLVAALTLAMTLSACGGMKASSTNTKPQNIEKQASVKVKTVQKPWQGANEAGQVVIIMYHRITEEKNDYDRSPENFKKDLERLYETGYRPISVADYLQGKIDIPGGMTPVIITFDDGDKTQYQAQANSLEPTEDSALGIMEAFRKSHPDFNPQATFFVNGANPFGEPERLKGKLDYLLSKGYHIGNHTYSHENMSKMSPEQVAEALGRNAKRFSTLIPQGEMNALALPFGVRPKDPAAKAALVLGEWENQAYHNAGIFNVGWCPEEAPWHKDFNPQSIKRIRSGDDADELGYWLTWLDKHPEKRYRSDGLAEVITVPVGGKEKLDVSKTHGNVVQEQNPSQ